MLVICNGAFKSGSTWLMQIVQAMEIYRPIPNECSNEKWANPSIRDDAFEDFFASDIYRKDNFYCKQHWFDHEKYRKLTSDPHIRVLNISRDLRDVLVSRYFHDLRNGVTNAASVEDYFNNEKGDVRLRKYMEYQHFWHSRGVNAPFVCRYEDLHSKFENEVERIAAFLGIELSNERIAYIKDKTAFSAQKETGEGKFFRKEIVGDWRNHIKDETVKKIAEMAVSTSYPFLESFE